MAIAIRWIGVGSIVLVGVGVGAMLVGGEPAPPPSTGQPDPVFELGRCEVGRSTFATNVPASRDFDQCLVDHMRDVLAMRHEDARMVVTTSMYSDLAICASHSTCSLARRALDPTRPWSAWTYSGKDAWFAGSAAVACAMVEQGGVHITSGPGKVSIQSEPGTAVEGCFRQFAPVEHIAR